jgi:hypothetical protein
MKHPIAWLTLSLVLFFAGCLAVPVEQSGGPGSITVRNSNPKAIADASRVAFSRVGYTPGPGNFPQTISFDRPADSFGRLMFGSYGRSTSFRVRLQITQIPGSNDFRVSPRVSRVNNAGEAGFESDTKMMGFWSTQFRPILREVQKQAANAGPGR